MSKSKPFTVSIFGRGRLLGLVVVDGIHAFPNSTWYDYSDQMKQAVQQELGIARSGHMRKDGVASVIKAAANQRNPRRTDVVLQFQYAGEAEKVTLRVGKRVRIFACNERTSQLADPWMDTSELIVRAIGQMMNVPVVKAAAVAAG